MEGNIHTKVNVLKENQKKTQKKRPLNSLHKVAAGLIILRLGAAIGWR
mgnify:CR=1 FL=1